MMKEQIKRIFLELGADLCGVASVDRFSEAPEGFHPADIYEGCKSVIAFGRALPKGVMKVNPRIVYKYFSSLGLVEIDRIACKAAIEIERQYDCTVVPLPADTPYDYWNAEALEGRGILSMRHAAALAGLGTLGKNTLLINEKYGNMLTIGAVLTDLELPSDPLSEELCIKGCRLCLDNCPSGALNGRSVNQKRCRMYTYETNARGFEVTKCNQCRAICPRAFGIS